ncbi:plasmid pRiA4b ORF-3 family protein [Desertibacillus haloalkaliphilus]|uniref:plasmid pRiA4b ORF-3 family protein n=1 Tax=Desertibacillus haloalkaliphilus TaxID=1328930 RepID=UPI001C274E6E|nr:plasmid pRiA4b ORF-3 family protein [Desertibacillus haloalkaliphilus]MBU8906543.1 plasmid pRiA4b ORF-3 family protein [Desertibacillus haloalkaliphilus]
MIHYTDSSGVFTYRGTEFITLNISLEGLSPKVYRVLTISANHTLDDLHFFIQGAFEWLASGPSHFDVDSNLMDKSLKDIFAEKERIDYTYLGWKHGVEVVANQEVGCHVSVMSPCIDGKRSRPPEFIRSVESYQAFLDVVNNPEHPQHEEMLVAAERDTHGRKFDPEYFYKRAANRKIDYYFSLSELRLEDGIEGAIESIDEGRMYIRTDHGPISVSDLEDLLGKYANQASIEIRVRK